MILERKICTRMDKRKQPSISATGFLKHSPILPFVYSSCRSITEVFNDSNYMVKIELVLKVPMTLDSKAEDPFLSALDLQAHVT